MARPASGGGAEVFEAYFQRADLNRDGKISGDEAVSFFQGFNLPKQILAQIWMHADQNRTGFLGRAEFFNALKLVTVAQSGRELTPDLVRAALFGPASSQIPPPVISSPSPSPAAGPGPGPGPGLPATANNQFARPQAFTRPPMPPPSSQAAVLTPSLSGLSAQALSGLATQPPRPHTPTPPPPRFPGSAAPSFAPASVPVPVPDVPVPDVRSSVSTAQNIQARASAPMQSLAARSMSVPDLAKPGTTAPIRHSSLDANDFSLLGASGSSPVAPSSSAAGGDAFPGPSSSLPPVASSSVAAPTSQAKQILPQRSQPLPLVPASGVSAIPPTAPAGGAAQIPWPKMSQSNVQSYTKIFSEVDTDRDGKITGQQARDLFLSWKLPREVLKQVWDLSDQDDDSMLSLREFCIALYLMERYREGRPLPQVLPPGISVDEAFSAAGGGQKPNHHSVAPNGIPWQQNPGMVPGAPYGAVRPMGGYPGTTRGDVGAAQTVTNHAGGFQKPQGDMFGSQMPGNDAPVVQSIQPKSRMPVLDMNKVNQLPRNEQDMLNAKHKDAEEAEKKVHELEKDIMDAKEKIDFYRSKLQELILYKTRCDNRINEITERAAAEKREVETMTKKYEEKYKQTGESHIRMASEEAALKDIQERRLELYNAIARIGQGGNADSLLQVRADNLHKDLEGLLKALKDRCKQLGLRAKPTSLTEMPFGWQPGIQETAAEWDDDWDKFEDEGFTVVQELVNEGPLPKHAEKSNSESEDDNNSTVEDEFDVSSSSNVDKKDVKPLTSEPLAGNGFTHAHSEDESAKSVPGSPPKDASHNKSIFDDMPSTAKSDQANSSHADDLFGNAGSWETAFTTGNDENDTFWGFEKNVSGTKGSLVGTSGPTFDGSRDGHIDNPQFDSLGSFNMKSFPVSSPRGTIDDDASSEMNDRFPPLRTKDKSPFSFSDSSVPNTPLFNTSSPGRHSNAGSFDDHTSHFDSFAKFDSFNARDSGIFSSSDPFASFDTFKADSFKADSFKAKYDDRSKGFTSFDDSDPFGSSGPFSLGGQTPKHNSTGGWSAF